MSYKGTFRRCQIQKNQILTENQSMHSLNDFRIFLSAEGENYPYKTGVKVKGEKNNF